MKKHTKITAYILSLFLGFSSLSTLASCGSDATTTESPTTSSTESSTSDSTFTGGGDFTETEDVEIEWDGSQLSVDTTLLSNDTTLYKLAAKATVNKEESDVVFSSDNENVAKILSDDKLQIVGVGETVIRARAVKSKFNKTELSFKLTIKEYKQISATIAESVLTEVNQTTTITTTDLPNGAKVHYTTESDVVTVDQTGTVTAVKDGHATIKVSAYYDVNEKEMAISETFVNVEVNTVKDPTVIVNAGVTEINANVKEEKELSITILNIPSEKITSVELLKKDGGAITKDELIHVVAPDYTNVKVNPQKAGTFELKLLVKYLDANSTEQELAVNLTITAVNSGSITLEDGNKTLTLEGQEIHTLKVEGTLNGESITSANCSFTSSNTEVATVDSDGQITAIKAGTSTITVTLKNATEIKATIILNVTPKYVLTVTTQGQTLTKSNTLNIDITATKDGTDIINTDELVVTYSKDGILSFNKETKVLTAMGVGQSEITFALKDEHFKLTFTVVGVINVTTELEDTINIKHEDLQSLDYYKSQFTVTQEGNDSISQDVEIVFEEGTQENFEKKLKGVYKLHAKAKGTEAKSKTITFNVTVTIDKLTIIYYDEAQAYENMNSLWMFGPDKKDKLISGVAEEQTVPESYAFREEIAAPSGITTDETKKALKFTIDTQYKYMVSSNWDNTGATAQDIAINDVNIGCIVRNTEKLTEGNDYDKTRDYNYNFSLVDEYNPTLYLYNNSNNFALGQNHTKNNLYEVLYSEESFVNYYTKADVSITSIKLGLQVLSDKNGWVTGLYTFGQESKHTQLISWPVEGGDKAAMRYATISLESPTEVYEGWNNTGSTTEYTYQLIDFSKIIYRDIGGNVQTDNIDLAFDKNMFNVNNKCVDGVLSINIVLNDYVQHVEKYISINSITIGENK